jgi:hypothetical protein
VLRIRTADADGRPMLDFERCAMLPLRDPEARTGHEDDVTAGRAAVDLDGVAELAGTWDLGALRDAVAGPHADELLVGDAFVIDAADPSRLTVESVTPLSSGGALTGLRSVVTAHRDDWSGEVLDWRFVAAVA